MWGCRRVQPDSNSDSDLGEQRHGALKGVDEHGGNEGVADEEGVDDTSSADDEDFGGGVRRRSMIDLILLQPSVRSFLRSFVRLCLRAFVRCGSVPGRGIPDGCGYVSTKQSTAQSK